MKKAAVCFSTQIEKDYCMNTRRNTLWPDGYEPEQEKQPMKTMSAAFKKIQDGRDQMNKGRQRILAKDLSSCVYLYDSFGGKPCAKIFAGRATWKNPTWQYSYASVERRAESVAAKMEAVAERVGAGRREIAKRELEVDDVLSASWGYEQTNVNYYKVVELKGKASVMLVEVGSKDVPSEGFAPMSGQCVPAPDVVLSDEPFLRRVNGLGVKIDSSRWASKDFPEMVEGLKVYKPQYYSSYH